MQINPTIRTLSDVPRLHAELRGAKPALIFDGRTISYAELYRRSRQVAQGLVEAGIGHGDRIAYLGKNTSDYFELLFGAALIGAVITPVNWRLAEDEVAWIVQHAEARAWFYQPEFASRLANVAKTATGVRLKLAIEAGDSGEYVAWRNGNQPIDANTMNGGERVSPDDVAVQVYTSGTTGRPKGAMLRHRNLLVFRALPPERQPVWNRWSDDDVSLITMPVFHIGCTGFGLQTLCAGSTGFIESEFDADRVMHCIEHERLSKLFVVPTALQSLLRHPRARDMDYGRIRTIIYGASPISPELLREAMDVFRCGFVQQYGMTEMTGTICALTPEDHDAAINDGPDAARRLTSAGRALEDVQIAILDEAGHRLPPGQVGEIAILSPTAMAGYWRDPEATAAVLDEQGWFRSGDAGYFDEQGFLYVSDRVKDMIVSGGENIYPAEIERVLAAHPAVLEVAVIGVPSERWGEEVKALVVLKPGESADAEALAVHSRRFLAGFKTPKSIEFVSALTRSGAGKVLRRVMREPYWAGRARRIG